MASLALRHFGTIIAICLPLLFGCSPAGQVDSGSADTSGSEAASSADTSDGQVAPASQESIEDLIAALESEDDQAQADAALKLSVMGEQAKPAIEALVKQLTDNDSHVRAHAARALGLIGLAAASATDALLETIRDEDAIVRAAAVEAVSEIHKTDNEDKRKVVPFLIKVLSDADSTVVLRVITTLAEFGPEIVPAMVKALEDDRTAYWACLVLTELGPDATDAVPGLASLLKHPHEEIRHEAAQALFAIGPGAKDAVPALIEALQDDVNAVRLAAALALGIIGSDAADASDELMEFTDDEDPDLLDVIATWALAKINSDPEELRSKTVPQLVEHLASSEQSVRRAAAKALLDLSPGPDVVAPYFAEVFMKASDEAKADMIEAIASLGEKAVPRMIIAMDFPSVRRQVVEVLGMIGPPSAPAVPALLKYVNDEDPELRREVLFTLGRIGPAAVEAIDALIAAMDDDYEEARYSAIYALGKIGPDASAALDKLQQSVVGDSFYCTVCAWALVRIDPSNDDNVKKALPLLIAALSHDESFVRGEIAETLGLLGPKAKEALPGLKELAENLDAPEQPVVVEAIEKIESGN